MPKKDNRYIEEIHKFEGSEVIVKIHENNSIKEIKGILKGINYSILSCVIMTPTEKILIKNFITITRLRKGEQKRFLENDV